MTMLCLNVATWAVFDECVLCVGISEKKLQVGEHREPVHPHEMNFFNEVYGVLNQTFLLNVSDALLGIFLLKSLQRN